MQDWKKIEEEKPKDGQYCVVASPWINSYVADELGCWNEKRGHWHCGSVYRDVQEGDIWLALEFPKRKEK